MFEASASEEGVPPETERVPSAAASWCENTHFHTCTKINKSVNLISAFISELRIDKTCVLTLSIWTDQVQLYLQECERRGAIRIQSAWRGFRVRRRYRDTLRHALREAHMQQCAARTLQRAVHTHTNPDCLRLNSWSASFSVCVLRFPSVLESIQPLKNSPPISLPTN